MIRAVDPIAPRRPPGTATPGIAVIVPNRNDSRYRPRHCFEDIHHREQYVSMHTSLGCPYKCAFCCINAPFGKPSYRLWSPESVIKEIDLLVETHRVKNIKRARAAAV